ncbi:MAG: hypothetical protein ACREXR_24420 [Gammaproteobacteria bacterium]
MPAFAYIALTQSGVRIQQEAVADAEVALRTELAERGLLVQEVRPKRSGLGLPVRRATMLW